MARGNGLWLDAQKSACLILWRKARGARGRLVLLSPAGGPRQALQRGAASRVPHAPPPPPHKHSPPPPPLAPQVEEWAQLILGWASTYGVSDSVMLLEDLSSGDDVRGTGAPAGDEKEEEEVEEEEVEEEGVALPFQAALPTRAARRAARTRPQWPAAHHPHPHPTANTLQSCRASTARCCCARSRCSKPRAKSGAAAARRWRRTRPCSRARPTRGCAHAARPRRPPPQCQCSTTLMCAQAVSRRDARGGGRQVPVAPSRQPLLRWLPRRQTPHWEEGCGSSSAATPATRAPCAPWKLRG